MNRASFLKRMACETCYGNGQVFVYIPRSCMPTGPGDPLPPPYETIPTHKLVPCPDCNP